MLPRNLLVPIDFSVGAGLALDYAIELASRLDAKVHLLNAVWTPLLGYPDLGYATVANVMEDAVRLSRVELEKIAADRRPTAPIGDVLLRTGDPRDVIVQVCKEHAIDLVVMGTHGRRGIKRALLGSVAEGVVRSAPCPVLTVREPVTS